jgi:DNA primase
MYNLEQLFEDYEIRYWTKGKNCTPGWVNIQCPFCNDKSNHLGINLATGKAKCWKCSASENIFNILMELLEINFHQAKKIAKKYEDDLLPSIEKEVIEKPSSLILPKEASEILPSLHKEYLSDRGFDPIALQKKYKLLACDMFGNYKFRLIIPIYFKYRLVNFAAMSVLPSAVKIKNCPNEKALIQRDELVYNYDRIINRQAIIVEGFADCWKMGDSCVATLGTSFSSAQVKLIATACDKAYILYDSPAKDPQAPIQAEKLANQLSMLGCVAEVVYLDEGDPGDLSLKEAARIKAELLN